MPAPNGQWACRSRADECASATRPARSGAATERCAASLTRTTPGGVLDRGARQPPHDLRSGRQGLSHQLPRRPQPPSQLHRTLPVGRVLPISAHRNGVPLNFSPPARLAARLGTALLTLGVLLPPVAHADRHASLSTSRAMWHSVDPAHRCVHRAGRLSAVRRGHWRFGTVTVADRICGNGTVLLRARSHSRHWQQLSSGSDWGYDLTVDCRRSYAGSRWRRCATCSARRCARPKDLCAPAGRAATRPGTVAGG